MDNETLQVILTVIGGIITTIGGSILTYLVTKKKSKVKIEDIYTERIGELLNSYKDEIHELKESVDKLTAKNEELQNTILALKTENHNLSIKVGDLVKENGELKKSLNNLSSKYDSVIEQNKNLILKFNGN